MYQINTNIEYTKMHINNYGTSFYLTDQGHVSETVSNPKCGELQPISLVSLYHLSFFSGSSRPRIPSNSSSMWRHLCIHQSSVLLLIFFFILSCARYLSRRSSLWRFLDNCSSLAFCASFSFLFLSSFSLRFFICKSKIEREKLQFQLEIAKQLHTWLFKTRTKNKFLFISTQKVKTKS